MTDTIAALSSGLVPSGVAVLRVSGPGVRFALERIAGGVPQPRLAKLTTLRQPGTDAVLDRALVLFFPAPHSFTGEDVAELHCHGGRAVVDAVLAALWSLDGVTPAKAGDFTRQAFINGKLDLTQVEAVGDLIHASTEAQRAQALDQLEGAASRKLVVWKDRLAECRALLEADLDFSDEDDVPGSVVDSLPERLTSLRSEIQRDLDQHFGERLRDGFRVVLAGAPNSGKSTLLNALLDREAALVSSVAGTTRDQIDVPVDMDGLPVVLTDTAGLRDRVADVDPIEAMGIERSHKALLEADCVLWLKGGEESSEAGKMLDEEKTIRLRSKIDLAEFSAPNDGDVDFKVSGRTGEGLDELRLAVAAMLRTRYAEGLSGQDAGASVALDARRRIALEECAASIDQALQLLDIGSDHLEQVAEELRLAQRSLGVITGDVDPEGVLDVLFVRFCIGK